MSNFAPLQHKRTKKTPSATLSSPVLQSVRDFTPPTTVPDSETVSSPDWQAKIARAERFGYSIGRLAIHRPDVKTDEETIQQASLPTSKQAPSIDGTLQLQQDTQATGISEQREENRTGLPDALKAGVERLSGYSLNDIRVHYNSPSPAEVGALAYTQGTEIHVGPGQEQHLAHEAWHVVQQKQRRVRPTLQAAGVEINDDPVLEREAEDAGKRTTGLSASQMTVSGHMLQESAPSVSGNVIQAVGVNDPLNDIASAIHPGTNRSTTAVGRLTYGTLVAATQENPEAVSERAQKNNIPINEVIETEKAGQHAEIRLFIKYTNQFIAVGASQPFCPYCQAFLKEAGILTEGPIGQDPSDKWLSPHFTTGKSISEKGAYPYAAIWHDPLGKHLTFWTTDEYNKWYKEQMGEEGTGRRTRSKG